MRVCVDNFYTGRREIVAPLIDDPYFETTPRRHLSPVCRGRRNLKSGLPSFTDALPTPLRFRLLSLTPPEHSSCASTPRPEALPNDRRSRANNKRLDDQRRRFPNRSFCFVEDMIEGLIRMINAPNDIIGPINLGNPRENSVKELAERVTPITGSRSRI